MKETDRQKYRVISCKQPNTDKSAQVLIVPPTWNLPVTQFFFPVHVFGAPLKCFFMPPHQRTLALMSHPILRIKLNALTHVCPGINHTHKLTNYKRVSSQCFLHHDSNNTQSYTSQRKIKDNSLSWNIITGKVNWLTTSLIILRKFLIPVVICYPSGIFIQIKKINKRK